MKTPKDHDCQSPDPDSSEERPAPHLGKFTQNYPTERKDYAEAQQTAPAPVSDPPDSWIRNAEEPETELESPAERDLDCHDSENSLVDSNDDTAA